MEDSPNYLWYTIHHVFLPPELPTTGDDGEAAKKELSLLEYLSQQLYSYSALLDSVSREAILDTCRLIERLYSILNSSGQVDRQDLEAALTELCHNGGVLPIPVRAQNAAVIVRKEDQEFIFEAFELCPPNEITMTTEGRLCRCFPGPAVAVGSETFESAEFRTTVAATIARLSSQVAPEMVPRAAKAGQKHFEQRDTTEPSLVVKYLMHVLEATGRPVQVPQVWKHTRDEVLHSTGLAPWRRSPVWLLARVAMHLSLQRSTGSDSCYKQAMVFFLSGLLDVARKKSMPGYVIHCMVAKISRRLVKLRPLPANSTWSRDVQNALTSAINDIQRRRDERDQQTDPGMQLWQLEKLVPEEDTNVELAAVEAHLERLRNPPKATFATGFSPPTVLLPYPARTLPIIHMSTSGTDGIFQLASFEAWVATNLMDWQASSMKDDSCCTALAASIEAYHFCASSLYVDNPENISVMVLTILELWICCDRVATARHPMLLDYDPRIPVELFQSLILPLRSDLGRLSLIEEYIRRRQKRTRAYPCLWTDQGKSSFAARYYQSSNKHQQLLAEIEASAEQDRERKKRQLADLKREYDHLMALHEASTCDKVWCFPSFRAPFQTHSSSCRKCSYRDQAQAMQIEVHEWPLPRKSLAASVVVFELQCPPAFSAWRDVTLRVLLDVLGSSYVSTETTDLHFTLNHFLRSFQTGQQPTRLILRSKTKPHTQTHRQHVNIAVATEADVCVHNGLQFAYYDEEIGCFASDVRPTEDLPKACLYKLQHATSLQDFLYRPHTRSNGPDPNCVIAEQHACPDDMKPSEFRALATLPLGTNLQWLNILVQLAAPDIDFKKVDTALVLAQAAYQAGPPARDGSLLRETHEILVDREFGATLLGLLRTRLLRIRENWESTQALSSFVLLASRLLALTPSTEVETRYLDFLGECRCTAVEWTTLMRQKYQETTAPEQRNEYLLRTFETALICEYTFNVEVHRLERVLSDSMASSMLIFCAITVQQTIRSGFDSSNYVHRVCVQRWKRLSFRIFPYLQKSITVARSSCLDDAISRIWHDYQPGGKGWGLCSDGGGAWLTTSVLPNGSDGPQTVHYNMLTAELLINGLPLSRLPAIYEENPRYRVLFGCSTLEVAPTARTGMQFSAVRPHRGYTVYFGLSHVHSQNGRTSDLLVLGECEAGPILLVPNRLLRDRLPQHFVDGYVHWYHTQTDVIEFRPISDPWASVQPHWVLERAERGWTLRRTDEDVPLVSLGSPTNKAITGLFRHIESAAYMHITWHAAHKRIVIELPRLRIAFTVEKQSSRVLSREYRGMYLDEQTAIGTFGGLRSKIVLVNDQKERLVLVPDGEVRWNRIADDFVEVFIREGTARKVARFNIDSCLGRLVDDGAMHSMLVRCYLHAVTAYCLPDNLTRKTGTEQALEILRSAALRSFNRIKPADEALLNLIAELTPRRDFYPPHLTVMQRISRIGGLNPLAQHCDLYRCAKAVLQQAASLEFLHHTKLESLTKLNRGEESLLRRDTIRSSTFHRCGFGAEHFTLAHDREYGLRKISINPHRSQIAFHAAVGIFTEATSKQHEIREGWANHIWHLLDTDFQVMRATDELDESALAFDADHLHQWKKILTMHWLQIHQALQQRKLTKPNFMMFVSTLALATDADVQVVQWLVALHNVPALRTMAIPDVGPLELNNGYALTVQRVESVLREFKAPFVLPFEVDLGRWPGETLWEARSRVREEFENKTQLILKDCAMDLVCQWPCECPRQPVVPEFRDYINLEGAMVNVRKIFKSCWENRQFLHYLVKMEGLLQVLPYVPLPGSKISVNIPARTKPCPDTPYITDKDILSTEPPILTPSLPVLDSACEVVACTHSTSEIQSSLKRVSCLVERLENRSVNQHDRDYVADLRGSLAGLKSQRQGDPTIKPSPALRSQLEQYHDRCQQHLHTVWEALASAAQSAFFLDVHDNNTERENPLRYCSPQISPVFFLRRLSRKHWSGTTPAWKNAIVEYGLALTTLQRARRLLAVCGDALDLAKELENVGHSNWQPIEHPESLLIEIESGILIREVQETIAREMRHPTGGENSVVQLLMGEGKSFVIVPIVAAALANGQRLVRVVVAKPQLPQMHQILVAKLAGMCGRRIYHMPISRSLRLGADDALAIGESYRCCMEEGGVLLVQPEHILSFKLMGIDNVLLGRSDVSTAILRTQRFLDDHSRDIVDESDENFSPKFELIYTMGTQRPIELAPERWKLVQSILDIVVRLVSELRERSLHVDVECRAQAGSFPRLRLLSEASINFVESRVAEEICASSLPGLPVSRQPQSFRDSFYRYITKAVLTEEEAVAVELNAKFWTDMTKGPTLLVRGLLAGGILAYALSHKRWRVNYGRDFNRTPPTRLAVPFRAKDSPTLRSEFSHPEMVTLLTCLSCYYGGLETEELFLALQHLIRSDHADSEYALWVRDCETLPPGYRSLTSINPNDQTQCGKLIFPHLSRMKPVVDYFLSEIVFAREMREFPHKLSVSGWDIGQRKSQPTTAFSGTNDSQHLLPITMRYRDIGQKHTNALVLRYLLQPENTVQLIPSQSAEVNDAEQILRLVTSQMASIQVIIDVGSQILELSNIAVAKRWLELTAMESRRAEKHAVVFFDDNDELTVIDRADFVEPLQTSPYAQQLDSCLIFLDEAHTRGTDLRLPEYYRAAVTLGANLTKDRLVQACMRLRKLGKGQSVVFCVTEEIQKKIRDIIPDPTVSSLAVVDVLDWAIHETSCDLRASIPLWAAQGIRYERQALIWQRASCEGTYKFSEDLAEKFLEVEAASLEQRYRPGCCAASDLGNTSSFMQGKSNGPEFSQIVSRCARFGCVDPKRLKVSLEEEQQRELSPEIVQQRQRQGPPPVTPLKHEIHPDVLAFIHTGVVPKDTKGFVPAFQALRHTTLSALFNVDDFPISLLVTQDFAQTVDLPQRSCQCTASDAFQRPVQWILKSTDGEGNIENLAIISPFEAQVFIPIIRGNDSICKVTLHLYAPKTNLAFLALDHLDLYIISPMHYQCHSKGLPGSFKVQLNLFAGQLWIPSFGDYEMMCEYLCLAWRCLDLPIDIQADGFIIPGVDKAGPGQEGEAGGAGKEVSSPQRFLCSPTQFLLRLLIRVRHDGRPVDMTHMGRLLLGEQLCENDFKAEIG